MQSDLSGLARGLDSALGDLEPMQHVIGQAGKKAAITELGKALGPDRRFSGFRRKVTLNAGYDVGTPVMLNMRPGGLVILADEGRKRRGDIRPRRGRGRRRAVLTPQGPRAYSSYGPSRGLKVIDKTVKRATDDIPKALSGAISGFITSQL